MRKLYPEEFELLKGLSRGRSIENVVMSAIVDGLVKDLPDGGMRSLRFTRGPNETKEFGREALVGFFVDADGIAVRLTINLDEEGRLFELDIFKADNTPLVRYPTPSEVRIEKT